MLPDCPMERCEWKRPTACHVIAGLHSAEKTRCSDMADSVSFCFVLHALRFRRATLIGGSELCSRTLPTSRASFSRRRAGCTRTVTSPSSSTSSARSRRHLPRTTRRISDRIFCQRTAPRPRLAQALGLAAALGRTLILPPVTCGYDKAWYALDKSGAFGGAPSWVVPIRNCPLDHYIESGELVRRAADITGAVACSDAAAA